MARSRGRRAEQLTDDEGDAARRADRDSLDNDSEKFAQWDDDLALFVFKQCLFSRVLLFVLQLAFNALLTDFPTDAFKGIKSAEGDQWSVDRWLRLMLSGLARWDAVHMLHVAEHGYTFENTLAFFPFFPAVVYYTTLCWSWACPFMNFSTALLLSALSINFVLFIVSGQLLYVLLLSLTKSSKVSVLGCLVFAFNPASVFFSAAYSETLFFFLTLCGLLSLYLDPTLPFFRHLLAALFFAFAFATRANGLLNFGYIAYQLGLETIYSTADRKYFWQRGLSSLVFRVFRLVVVGGLSWCIFSSVVVSHSTRMQRGFCSSCNSSSTTIPISETLAEFARQNALVLPCDVHRISWCSVERQFFNPMPVFYAPIQSKYWDVKAFGYWQVKKIPCFLMAAPVLFIVAYGCVQQFACWRNSFGGRCGFLDGVVRDPCSGLPFLLHALVLSVSALVIYNVEVATRILFSSSPFVYMVLARYMHARTPLVTIEDLQYPPLLPFFTNFSQTHCIHAMILCYLLGYFFVGTLLHVNWLPFT